MGGLFAQVNCKPHSLGTKSIFMGDVLKREKQKKIKELENSILKTVKANLKPYGFKTKGYKIWCVQNDLFFTMMLSISTSNEDGCNFYTHIRAKPMYADDLFWDIMDMRSNKRKPLSLRAIGVFALFGAPVTCIRTKMETLEISELEELVKKALGTLYALLQQIKGKEIDWFYAQEKKQLCYYQDDALRVMMLLHHGKYTETMEYIHNSDSGNGDFVNEGKSLYERVSLYCKRKNKQIV